MDEKNLKRLFIEYIHTGQNDRNNFLSLNPQDQGEIRIKDEGYHRNLISLLQWLRRDTVPKLTLIG